MKHTALLLGLSLAALAQRHPTTRPEFVLGVTSDELHRTFGVPSTYWDVQTKSYLTATTEIAAARELGHRLIDVYEPKTARNTYEFRAAHEFDERQSHLHPTRRITDVVFELDRPVPATDFKTLLADFPEAATLCAGGCTIYDTSGYYGLSVQPTNPSLGELREATLIRTLWNSQTMIDTLRSTEATMRSVAGDLHKPYRSSVPIKTIRLKREGERITAGYLAWRIHSVPAEVCRGILKHRHLATFKLN
jgi:hypothetical protein